MIRVGVVRGDFQGLHNRSLRSFTEDSEPHPRRGGVMTPRKSGSQDTEAFSIEKISKTRAAQNAIVIVERGRHHEAAIVRSIAESGLHLRSPVPRGERRLAETRPGHPAD